MKQLFITLIAIFLFSIEAMSQNRYPQGLYMSFDEIRQHQPSVLCSLQVVRRSNFDISMNGGNDYKIESDDKAYKKSIKKKAWAYSDGDTLYINCLKFKAQPWYAKVDGYGKYLLFYGGISTQVNEYFKTSLASFMFGIVGGAIASASAAHLRYYYAVDTDTGKMNLITLQFLDKVLSARDASIYTEFQKDTHSIDSVKNEEQKAETEKVITQKYVKYINL